MEKLAMLSELFEVSLDQLVLGKVPVTTKLDALGEKVLTDQNRERAKRGVKLAAIILGAVVAVDLISMIVYFLAFGFPA